MKDISDAADLIATAREALLRDLLPTLPKDRRYVGLMIANAMAIAVREQISVTDAGHDEAQRLRDLLGDLAPGKRETGSAAADGDLPALRRTVCAAIRSGHFDGPARGSSLASALMRTAAEWVAISNPKALRPDAGARTPTP